MTAMVMSLSSETLLLTFGGEGLAEGRLVGIGFGKSRPKQKIQLIRVRLTSWGEVSQWYANILFKPTVSGGIKS